VKARDSIRYRISNDKIAIFLSYPPISRRPLGSASRSPRGEADVLLISWENRWVRLAVFEKAARNSWQACRVVRRDARRHSVDMVLQMVLEERDQISGSEAIARCREAPTLPLTTRNE